jgi:hypothetical protein
VGTVSVFLNHGNGQFAARRAYRTKGTPNSLAVADFNADGKQDVAVGKEDGAASVLLNGGHGRLQTAHDYRTGDLVVSIAAGDLNNDHRPDLATANLGSGSVSVLLNKGGGRFRASRDFRVAHFPANAPQAVAMSDLNNDGKPDLATANVTHNISVLINAGHGRFLPRRIYRSGKGPHSIAISDLNGDGKADLVTADLGANTISVLLNKASRRKRS